MILFLGIKLAQVDTGHVLSIKLATFDTLSYRYFPLALGLVWYKEVFHFTLTTSPMAKHSAALFLRWFQLTSKSCNVSLEPKNKYWNCNFYFHQHKSHLETGKTGLKCMIQKINNPWARDPNFENRYRKRDKGHHTFLES